MRFAIIGGGPSGLMTAYLLRQRGVAADITIFEASPRLGGKVLTHRFESAPVSYEAGTAELYDYSGTAEDPLREMVEDLGLSTYPLEGQTVFLDGVALRTDSDIRRHLGQAAFDALQEFRCRARASITPDDYYESDWLAHNRDPLSRQTFHELLETVPNALARKYIRVAVHSDLATEPGETNAIYGLHNFLMNEPEYMRLYTIDGGLEQLTTKLAARISARILLNHRVVSVEKTRDETYRLRFRHHGAAHESTFDSVVAALPNNWLPAIEWGGEKLATAMHAHHARYHYPAHYLRVSMLFRTPFWRSGAGESYFMLDDFGGCCVYDETPHSVAPQHGVLGWLLAGDAALNLSNFDDGTIAGRTLESLPGCFGYDPDQLLETRVHRWVGSVNALPGGNPQTDPDSRHVPEPEENPRLLVVGDYLFDSTLNGALDSADIAVEFLREIAALSVGCA
jgi:monoamine oxidase